MGHEIIIRARDLAKTYARGGEKIAALDGVSLDIARGDFVAIVGPSGSGKTTLLNILGCLDNPDAGTLAVDGIEVFGGGRPIAEGRLTRIRRERYGYIFQDFHLLPTLTVEENVSVPLAFSGRGSEGGDIQALLESLGLGGRALHFPGQLSGGEMQRAAIARALVNRPAILMADEPTGNLDSARGREIGELVSRLNRDTGITVIMVTHNPELASLAGRVVDLMDGKIRA